MSTAGWAQRQEGRPVGLAAELRPGPSFIDSSTLRHATVAY